jgi:hypothetical protein
MQVPLIILKPCLHSVHSVLLQEAHLGLQLIQAKVLFDKVIGVVEAGQF